MSGDISSILNSIMSAFIYSCFYCGGDVHVTVTFFQENSLNIRMARIVKSQIPNYVRKSGSSVSISSATLLFTQMYWEQ